MKKKMDVTVDQLMTVSLYHCITALLYHCTTVSLDCVALYSSLLLIDRLSE